MKMNITKQILFICVLVGLFQGTLQAAGQRKISEVSQATSDLLATLRQNAKCLVNGTCPAEQKQKLRSLARKIVVAVAVISAAAATVYMTTRGRGNQDAQKEQVVVEEKVEEDPLEALRKKPTVNGGKREELEEIFRQMWGVKSSEGETPQVG